MIATGVVLGILAIAEAGPATEASFKGQFCTDPRTMRKHAAYTEWADAYSCTRHRCQPGGRNLAIYTVGCKRVEAPESAIECEEVVEDTNMQFPYCCTRLRCLVVVRGEVWTRVLGQPWETLPAAPWSHMYKMKKPPPSDGTFLPKTGEGPIYELQTQTDNEQNEKTMRSKNTNAKSLADCNDAAVARAVPPAPDIVIALSTNSDKESLHKMAEGSRHKRGRKQSTNVGSHDTFDEESVIEPRAEELEDTVTEIEKNIEPLSEERYYENTYADATKKPSPKIQTHNQGSWTEIPQIQWNEHDPSMDADPAGGPRVSSPSEAYDNEPLQNTQFHQPDFPPVEEKKEEKSGNLQALVDAIGTRMRDIESVVQKMSEKVQTKPSNPEPDFASSEKRNQESRLDQTHPEGQDHSKENMKEKKHSPDSEHYNRFVGHNRGSKYLHGAGDLTTEQPLFVEDTNLNGYYSDASNSLRRAPKEPAATYMAPVDNRRKSHYESEETEKKHKKKTHRKRKTKGHHKKHHGKEEKRKRFNRVNSVELDKNTVSIEDSSSITVSQ